jgi:hypothetical protein
MWYEEGGGGQRKIMNNFPVIKMWRKKMMMKIWRKEGGVE